jgi:RND family efflux transporter MFP subunit
MKHAQLLKPIFMKSILSKSLLLNCAGLLLLSLTISSNVFAEEGGHAHEAEKHAHEEAGHDDGGHNDGDKDEHGHGDHDEEAASDAELNDKQRSMAGIETMMVKHQALGAAISAPGEVVLNAYRTIKVTPRISAQVIQRHVRLGSSVTQGKSLVTLSSVEMAEAQGLLLENKVELRRVKKLGRKVVSEKRFTTAQIAYQQAYAKVRAYGMTPAQIDALLKTGDARKATGQFVLVASQSGTIISDKFIVGEIIEPGRILFEISDESTLWVEARLSPKDVHDIQLGATARVKIDNRWLTGKVIQARHTLDEATRTLGVHIEIANPDDALHPGQFVSVLIEGKDKRQGIIVPLAAVMRAADGDWQVFMETSPGRFEPKEVEVLQTVGDQMLIDGIAEGTTIVSKGAFFVQSEIAKGGFEVHNH